MTVDASNVDIRQGCGAAVECQRIVVGDAVLVFREPGRNVRMRLWINIRVDAQADRSFFADVAGNLVKPGEFRRRFDIEAEDVFVQSEGEFSRRLSDAGKYDLAGICASGQSTFQFADRNDVESGTKPSEHIEYGQV